MFNGLNYLHLTAMFNLILPVILNLCIPNVSALWVILNPIRFLLHVLFLPTMQGYFLTLAIARTYDLSWGNRAGIGEEVEELKAKSALWAFVQCALNAALPFFLYTYRLSDAHDILLGALWFAFVTPMTLISIGSVFELLGRLGMACLVVASVPLALCNGPLMSTCDIGGLSLGAQVVAVVVLVLVFKSFMDHFSRIPKRFL